MPVEFSPPGERGGGVFIIIFALFFGGMPTAMMIAEMSKGSYDPTILLSLVFTVAGAALLYLGVHLAFSSARYRIASDAVYCEKKTLAKQTSWTEPLANYRGVLSRSEYHRGGRKRSSYTLYIVELWHEDREKRVPFHSSRSQQGVRELWEAAAKALNVPALEYADGHLVTRAVDDLDKSVQELVREKEIKVEDVSLDHPPAGISASYQDGRYVLLVGVPPMPAQGLWVLAAVPAVFIGVFWMVGFHFGAVLAAAGFGFYGFRVFATKTRIAVGAEDLQIDYILPFGVFQGARIPKQRIEGVNLKHGADNTRSGFRVVIATDRGSHSVFYYTSNAKSIAWLKNAILKMVVS